MDLSKVVMPVQDVWMDEVWSKVKTEFEQIASKSIEPSGAGTTFRADVVQEKLAKFGECRNILVNLTWIDLSLCSSCYSL